MEEQKTKYCSRCKLPKPLNEFDKNHKNKNGLASECKTCKHLNYVNRRNKLTQKELKIHREKERLRAEKSSRARGIKPKKIYKTEKEREEAKKHTKKLWYKNNKELTIYRTKQWIEKNKNTENYKNSKKKSKKKQRTKNPNIDKEFYKKYPHIVAWRNTLKNTLSRFGKKKEGHTIDLLGYSALELKEYITSLFTPEMSWDNYGEWHIDHIKRVSEFDKETPMDIVNSLSNLRPLWATNRTINGVFYEGNLNRN